MLFFRIRPFGRIEEPSCPPSPPLTPKGSALYTLRNFALYLAAERMKSESSHERLRAYSFKTKYSLNSQAFVVEATLTIPLKKITSEVKFAEQKSALLQNKKV